MTLEVAEFEQAPAWTTEQVLRITGISRRRLAYWLDKDIVTADIDEARGRGRVRLWSFANLVEVRVALWLRDRVSLQLIGKIIGKLRGQGIEQPLAEVRFAVVDTGKPKRPTDVVVQRPDGAWETPIAGQIVMEVVLPLHRSRRKSHGRQNATGLGGECREGRPPIADASALPRSSPVPESLSCRCSA